MKLFPQFQQSKCGSRLAPVALFRNFALLTVALSLTVSSRTGHSYALEPASWPSGNVTLQLGLGNAGRTLSDGNTSWDTVAGPGFAAWNQSIQSVQLVGVTNANTPVSAGDHVNVIVFANSAYGHSFGSNTVAVTYFRYSGGTMTEADILFNNNRNWDSYRGPLRNVTDLRRVLIHELGHVLGLDHPDDHGQHVDAIMNSVVSNRETTSSDDINGARSLYGSAQSTPTPTPIPTPTPVPTPTPTPPSTISLSASTSTVSEGGSATFTLSASSVSNVSRTVSYTMSGKAVPGNHYTLSGTFGQVTLSAGATTTTVTLTALPNSIRRRSKTATMTLRPGSGYQLSFSNKASIRIVNSPR